MQNEIDKKFTDAELKAVDDALTVLETTLTDLPVLSADDKAAHVKAPDNSRGWMEGMVIRAQQNLGKLPRDFDPALMQKDLDFTAAVAPRLLRAQRIVDRFTGGTFLADSDTFAAALEVRRQLKDSGVAGVDDNLSDGLQRFFNRSKSAAPAPTTPTK
ncbi:MAG: hypothetical protein WCK57_10415 [Verrucomicrobiae bacterium]